MLPFLRLVYHATALCRIGDFQGGECLIYLSVTSIAVCARNGGAVGSWPYNVIRDFSCQDGNFSFTSGRRGPFGIEAYQFELTPPVLAMLTSAITVLTGAQFAPKVSPPQQELKSSIAATFSVPQNQPCTSSAGQHCTPNSSLPLQPLTNDACGKEVTKPLHSYHSLPELRYSGMVHSSHPHLLKKQMSSPVPRPCHRYEEIDPPDAMTEAAGVLPSTFVLSANINNGSGLTLPYLSLPVGVVSTSQNTTSPGAAGVSFGPTVRDKQSAANDENIQNGREKKRQHNTINITADFGHPESLHKSGMQELEMPDMAAGVYDCPHQALYSVPTCCRGEVLTLKTRQGRTQVPPPTLSNPNVLYCNVLSSKLQPIQGCHSSEETSDGGLYEEINSAAKHPSQRQPSGHYQNAFIDQKYSMDEPACIAVASMIAQQLATEEGYELVTSMRHAVSHNAGTRCVSNRYSLLADVGQRGPEKLYINQNLMSASHPEAE